MFEKAKASPSLPTLADSLVVGAAVKRPPLCVTPHPAGRVTPMPVGSVKKSFALSPTGKEKTRRRQLTICLPSFVTSTVTAASAGSPAAGLATSGSGSVAQS
jgi:hypothetical protein